MKLSGLYGITDGSTGQELINKVKLAISGGMTVLQYRDKSSDYPTRLNDAMNLRELCCSNNIPLIINDDVELAKMLHADGVHLGQDDMSIGKARRYLGDNAIIGISCYNQLDLALAAQKQGASYVAFGAFFPSPTKPKAPTATLSTLQVAKQKIHIPICTIGGITLDNASQLIDNGADMVAVISNLFSADDIGSAAQQFSKLFTDPIVIH